MTNIDQHKVNESYLVKAGEILGPIKKLSYEALSLQSNRNILDVGCGPGIDCSNMAQITPTGWQFTGVDFDERMINAATAAAQQLGLSEKLVYQQADAYELPFDQNVFCATRSERLLMHLNTPDLALAEMVRVTKPGGKLVVIDTDWASLSSSTGDDVIERKICHHLANDMLPNGYSGRNLAGQFKGLQLESIDINVSAFTVSDPIIWRLMGQLDQVEQSAIATGVVTQEEISQWHDCIKRHFEAGKFHATLNLTLAVGTLPL